MNSPASGTRHGFVNLTICWAIGSDPALHLQTSSWAAVYECKNHLPAIWQTVPLDALLISANRLFAGATFTRDEARRITANAGAVGLTCKLVRCGTIFSALIYINTSQRIACLHCGSRPTSPSCRQPAAAYCPKT